MRPKNLMRFFIAFVFPALLPAPPAALHAVDAPPLPRPKLQIINGSHKAVDIFWLKPDGERVSNGSVAPEHHQVCPLHGVNSRTSRWSSVTGT